MTVKASLIGLQLISHIVSESKPSFSLKVLFGIHQFFFFFSVVMPYVTKTWLPFFEVFFRENINCEGAGCRTFTWPALAHDHEGVKGSTFTWPALVHDHEDVKGSTFTWPALCP